MTWAHPELFPLLLLVPLVALLAISGWRARRAALARFAEVEALASLLPPGVHRKRTWQAILAVVATLLLAVAAAGPRLGFDWEQRRMEGISLVVVLDVSRSMDAADVTPSRMERARREIADLVALLRGDAVGLVIFAAGAYTRIPLTVDYDTLLWAVNDTTTGTIRAQGTSLAGALDQATQMLSRAEGSGKAVLVVSDGEAHDADAPLDAAISRAREEGVRVYALGVGEPGGAPIPEADGGFKKDARGEVVLSKLDEDRLQRLAAETGGAYVRAVASDEDVRALYEGEIRGKLEAAARGVRRDKVWRERFQWPLAGALLAMVTASALGIGRRRVAALLLAALLPALAPRAAWAGSADDGLAAYRAGEWAKASELLGQARVEDPDDPEVGGALAESLYRSGRFREAERLYTTLAEQDSGNRAVWLYDAGNAAYRGGRLPEALERYEDALAADPALEPAKKNADAVKKEIQARLREEPPPPQAAQDQQGGAGQQGEPPPQGQPGEEGQGDAQAEGQPEQGGEPKQGEGRPGEQPPEGSAGAQAAEERGAEGGAGGEPQDGQAEAPPGTEGGGRPGEQGTRPEGEGTAAPGQEALAEGEDTPEGAPAVDEVPSGAMSPEAAARLVDGVPDGKPRVVVGGRPTEKDW